MNLLFSELEKVFGIKVIRKPFTDEVMCVRCKQTWDSLQLRMAEDLLDIATHKCTTEVKFDE